MHHIHWGLVPDTACLHVQKDLVCYFTARSTCALSESTALRWESVLIFERLLGASFYISIQLLLAMDMFNWTSGQTWSMRLYLNVTHSWESQLTFLMAKPLDFITTQQGVCALSLPPWRTIISAKNQLHPMTKRYTPHVPHFLSWAQRLPHHLLSNECWWIWPETTTKASAPTGKSFITDKRLFPLAARRSIAMKTVPWQVTVMIPLIISANRKGVEYPHLY